MKKNTLLVLIGILISFNTLAQWKNFKAGPVSHTYHTETGNVGIGTLADVVPTQKLQVVGNIQANNFITTTGVITTSGTPNLTLNTNGTPQLTVLNANGFVGIGVPTPSEKLHVDGNVLSTQYTATNGMFNSSGDLLLSTIGTNRVRILSSNGFVGIGTAPSEMLHVNGNVLSNQYSAVMGIFNSPGDLSLTTNGTSRLSILNASGFVGIGTVPTEMLHVNGNVLSNQYTASTGIFNSSGNLTLSTNGTNRINVINESGFVGIGTTPTEKLHVSGNILSTGNMTSAGLTASTATFTNVTADNTSVNALKAGGLLVAENTSYANPAKNDLVVKGKVAIGTPLSSNPNNYTLAVNGKIGAKDIQVETKSTTWPDYVFSQQYKLPSLYEVEEYVKENNHLQDVPSAAEIEQEHNLGKMDAILLKKIEELTLYIIQQQKEIDALKKQLEDKK